MPVAAILRSQIIYSDYVSLYRQETIKAALAGTDQYLETETD